MAGGAVKVAGIGCRAGAPVTVLTEMLAQAEALAGPVDAVATIAPRAAEITALNRPLRIVAIAGIDTPTQSPRIQSLHGTGSVAEAAALAACGPGARLILNRIASPCGRATIAIAIREETP
ncbi:cobalamin biosynthesis protein [Paracoccus sp. M683]|uniref:cobalamin biosynthesis protein n=1 Tax=Paracoccus sp. M683 TaxID=2594268 RepID=UPI00117D8531|nr:cobalamin biosynthesis protein [Paracoccus sp. M683]TRW96548.1 cobalamin biosynthesis protein [Paracoccus sp. M683]